MNTPVDASHRFGRDLCPGPKLEGWMKDAGFEEIWHEKFRLPIGPWAKDKHLVCYLREYVNSNAFAILIGPIRDQKIVGAWNLIHINDGIEGFTLRLFTQFQGWKAEEVLALLAKVRNDLRDPGIHALFNL